MLHLFKKSITQFLMAGIGICCGISQLHSEEPVKTNCCQECCVEEAFGYVDLGVGPLPVLLPNFATGFRQQFGHHGYDVSFSVLTVVKATQLKEKAMYHYYFNPNSASEFYAGVGVGVSELFLKKKLFGRDFATAISPELVFGKKFQTDGCSNRFFQAEISFPTISFESLKEKVWSTHHTLYMPLVVFSYGWGF